MNIISNMSYCKNKCNCLPPFPGPQGPRGPPGLTFGTMIPFSSGRHITLTVDSEGNPDDIYLISNGSSYQTTYNYPTDITITSLTTAFSIPKACVLTDFSIFFSATQDGNFDPAVTLYSQIFISTPASNTFVPIHAITNLNLGTYNTITSGQVISDIITDISIEIPAQSLILLAMYTTSAGGGFPESDMVGIVSAGLYLGPVST